MFFDIHHTIFTSDVDIDTLIDLGLYNSRADRVAILQFSMYINKPHVFILRSC